MNYPTSKSTTPTANTATVGQVAHGGVAATTNSNTGRFKILPKTTSITQHKSIISLSKLKSYMPQNQVAARLFERANSCSVATSNQPVTYYREGNLDHPSSYLHNNHENLARANAISLRESLSLVADQLERIAPTHRISIGTHEENNQVLTAVQQRFEQQRQQQQQQHRQRNNAATVTDLRLPNFGNSAIHKNVNKAELGGAEQQPQPQPQQQQLQQQQSQPWQAVRLLATKERERKQNKIDLPDGKETIKIKEAKKKEEAKRTENEGKESRGSYSGRNNMTPSSLLLLQQNHNFIEQHQQSHHQRIQVSGTANCSAVSTHSQPERANDTSVGQSKTTIADNCSRGNALSVGGATTVSEQSGESQSRLTHPTESSSLSSSSPMLNNTNQFKDLDSSVGNSSSSGSANQLATQASSTSSCSIRVDSSDYLTNQDPNQIHSNQLPAVEALTGNSVNNLQQQYQQELTCDLKTATGIGAQFVHYSTQHNNRISNNNYHPNFQASMLGQHMKLENGILNSDRSISEGNHSILSEHNNIQAGNPNVDFRLGTGRGIAQQQISNTSQNYNSNYNLLPSKSSSPTSSTSSPSPKTSAMHPITSQHSNHLSSSSLAANPSCSQIHLDHLNHHYMSNNVAGSLSHQQHQVNQHYAYNQQATSGPNQHHLSMSNHEQAYAQHQHHQLEQQHHQQHQQQQQQTQQQQQHHHHHHHHQQQLHQQQHHHQQQQQQQNIQNQQSIYHHLANNAANVNHIYGNTGASTHYQGHLQASANGGHQSNHLISGAHQNHLNTAAAACAAAAVVSQTLKTVASQQTQQHQHYGSSIANGFNATNTHTGSLINITAQQHHQFHTVNSLANQHHHHHLGNQGSAPSHSQQSLPAHHTTSIVTRKYQCKMCPQVFTSKAEMKYHHQNHMREAKPYKCLQCPKAFANSSYLSQHMRIHQGVKPYTCDTCSRKFTQLSHLQQHKRTHTGDKPYKCNYMNCTKQFSQLSNLQSHSRCHQLDKPYKCNSCYKCFHDEQSLLEHIPRHLESKHLKKNLCIFCGSSYQQERGLVKHFQQYHTDKTPTLVAAAIAAGTTGNTNLIASLVSTNPSNTFATPSSNGSSSSSSSSSSISSSGSLNAHNNLNAAHGVSAGFGTKLIS